MTTNTSASEGDQLTSLLCALAGLQRLEELELEVPSSVPQPSLLLPRLRRLVLPISEEMLNTDLNAADFHETLPVQLVRSCTDSLRDLQLHFSPFVSDAHQLGEALRLPLSRCASLRSLRIDVRCVAAVKELHQLDSLRLDLRRFSWGLVFETDQLQAVVDDVQRAVAPLRALRSLALEFSDSDFEDELAQPALDLFTAVARLAANATSLRVTADDWLDPLVKLVSPAVLDCMPGLQDVSFLEDHRNCYSDGGAGVTVDVLHRLLGLRDLRRVSGQMWAEDAEGLAHCEEALATFRRQRPDVESDGLVCSQTLLESSDDDDDDSDDDSDSDSDEDSDGDSEEDSDGDSDND